MAEFGGTAEICKTRIQQPLTAAYEFWQIPADDRAICYQIEIGELFCSTLLNLRDLSLNRQAQLS
jgi:hypothetical protein